MKRYRLALYDGPADVEMVEDNAGEWRRNEDVEVELAARDKRIAQLTDVCQALAQNATYEHSDGDVTCHVCGSTIRDADTEAVVEMTDELIMNAEHDEWCPVPMAFKLLKGGAE